MTCNLRPSDLQRYYEFRIPDQLIDLHQIFRVTDAEARAYGMVTQGDLAGVVTPIWGAEGTIKGYRLRRDNPEMEGGKVKNKYIQSRDPAHLFFERTSRQYLSDPTVDLVFVEAATSAMAIAAWAKRMNVRIMAVATDGCWGWRGRIGKVENEPGVRVDQLGPLPDLDLIPLQQRTAVIFCDANFNSNSSVQRACRAFARELASRGAVVRIAITPEEPNVNGPDDFISRHSDDEFLRLSENATEFTDAIPRSAAQADKLVELAEGVEFFHADVDQPFAGVEIGSHVETWPVNSRGFRFWLSGEYYRKHQKAPSSQALQAALNVLGGRAIHDGPKIPVHTRVAEHVGNLYLDMADDEWRAIEITPEGWNIITDVPVKFIRPRGMLPIPSPIRGGSLDELRPFLNVADEESFALMKAFLIATLRPNLPFAFLVLTGEQGSGKTAQSNRLKSIIDPGKAPVRGLPRELRDLAIAAGNSWLLAFDNVSTIPPWMSDALCSLSTGGGFSTRDLYTDSDERIFDAMRPVILNGIGDIVSRPDLLDRSIVQELPVIPEDKRKQESELQLEYESARPRILGALLDAAVVALRDCASVRLESLPRMADFATWAVAAEPVHSRELVFLEAYYGNRANLHQVAIDTSIIGPHIQQILNGCDRWSGLLMELSESLNAKVPDSVGKSHSWPSLPRELKSHLIRLAPNLRQIGIQVTFEKRTNKGIPVTLERSGNSSSSSSP